MKIVGYQIILRITRFVTLVIHPDYQKFCLRSTPARELGCIHTFKVKHEFAITKCLKYNLPKCMNDTPKRVKDKINTHSLQGFINYGKNDMIHKYCNICIIQHCYICQQSQLHL